MILLLLGRSGCGKSRIEELLITRRRYRKVVTYTTRKRREGELEDSYHFGRMNRQIRRKINKRAENRLMNFMAAHSDICMPVRCRWMAILDAENRYRILTPLERRVFLSVQEQCIRLVDGILDELKEEE